MGSIRRLPEEVVKLIAAGEVIIGPFSVVKELVENSLDAGARNIYIKLKDGGKKEITVKDDGCGMDREDAVLAWERYSTSKIFTTQDLLKISSLGFRGEALPSIAQVALVTLTTSNGEEGTKVKLKGGKILSIEEISVPKGTQIKVEEIFYNAPVRKKSLRSAGRELRDILEVVMAYSFVSLSTSFRVENDGEEVFFTPPRSTLIERLEDIWGSEFRKSLIPLEFKMGDISIEGWVSRPGEGKSYPLQFFFVNGRWVKGKIFKKAIMEAYASFMGKGYFPMVFLFLTLPTQEVDVNIHPSKEEVKFKDEGKIMRIIENGIRNSFHKLQDEISRKGEEKLTLTPSPIQSSFSFKGVAEKKVEYVVDEFTQVKKAYLIREIEEGILIIDQHALHERILFEKLKYGISKRRVEKKNLLFPVTLELSPVEEKIIEEHSLMLKELGFELEKFGRHTFILRSMPQLLGNEDPLLLIAEVVGKLKDSFRKLEVQELMEEVLKTLACRGAIKFGDRLSSQEMERLIQAWREEKEAITCPHGRPVFVLISWEEIEKRFQRR